jgi:hypothetical protein
MTYDAKAEAERLLEPFSVEYVEYDPDKMGDEHPRDAIRNGIAATITAAYVAGRESMREEAAKIADRQAMHDPTKSSISADEQATHRRCAMSIAAAIRAAKAPEKRGNDV